MRGQMMKSSLCIDGNNTLYFLLGFVFKLAPNSTFYVLGRDQSARHDSTQLHSSDQLS